MKDKYLHILLLIIIIFVVYANSLGNKFVYDDEFIIVNNYIIKDPHYIKDVFKNELIKGSFTNYYRPIQTLTYMLDYRLWKLKPAGFHLINILLHILNAVLLYIILSRITKDNIAAFIVSILFGVHPVNTEVVTYISGRSDALCALFVLSGILAYLKYNASNRRLFYLLTLGLFVLAVLSKEIALVFPFVIILYDVFLKKINRYQFKNYFPFFVIIFFYVYLRFSVIDFSNAAGIFAKFNFIPRVNFMQRLLNLVASLFTYLKVIILPADLHMERLILIRSIFELSVIAVLLVAALAFFSLRILKVSAAAKRTVVLSLMWFFIFFLPQSNLFLPLTIAEHFLYLPQVGIFLIFAIFLQWLSKGRKAFSVAVFGIFTVFFGLTTISQNTTWHDSITFYRWTLKFSPYSVRIHNNLANIYASMGEVNLAIKEYEEALKISPNYAPVYDNMQIVFDNTIAGYKKILKKSPFFASVHYNLGLLYSKKGMLKEAESSYRKAVKLDPKLTQGYNNLGCILERSGLYDEAIKQFQKSIDIDHNFKKGYFNLGVVHANQGNFDLAIKYWNDALKLDPNYKEARANIEVASQLKDAQEKLQDKSKPAESK